MFNLLVGQLDGQVPPGRFLEYTAKELRQELSSDFRTVGGLPTLAMPEIGDDESEQVARLGRVVALKETSRGLSFRFVETPNLAPIDSGSILRLASQLDIDGFEFRRTHWAVKDVDLFEVLFEDRLTTSSPATTGYDSTGAVQFPIGTAREAGLVAVMMPFDKAFDIVYETIEQAVSDAGLRCVRADDIWDHDNVLDDILGLIWRSQIVIADLTGKNPNVFYEVGLAHSLPRRTVLLTQNSDDVPFDLRSLRYLKYGLGTRDRQLMRSQLEQRLRTILAGFVA